MGMTNFIIGKNSGPSVRLRFVFDMTYTSCPFFLKANTDIVFLFFSFVNHFGIKKRKCINYFLVEKNNN